MAVHGEFDYKVYDDEGGVLFCVFGTSGGKDEADPLGAYLLEEEITERTWRDMLNALRAAGAQKGWH